LERGQSIIDLQSIRYVWKRIETRARYAVLRRLPLKWAGGVGYRVGGGRLFREYDIGNTIVCFYAFVKFVIIV
jgi:hypothetical protein